METGLIDGGHRDLVTAPLLDPTNDKKIEISNKLCLKSGEKLDFDSLYESNSGKVAAFLAVLDLVKDNFCELEKRNNKLFLFF